MGSALGAAAVPAADAVISGINALFGTEWTTASDAVRDWMQRKGFANPPESAVMATLEQAINAVGSSFVGTGIAGNIANAPSAGNVMNAAKSPMTMTSGATGAPVAPTAGNTIAAQMANQPVLNAAVAAPSTFAQEGTSRGLQSAGVPEPWADAAGFAVGLLSDVGLSSAADNLAARAGARSAPVPEQGQQLIDITQRNQPGRPLTTDEAMVIDPTVTPTARETRSIGRHIQNPRSGVTDAMLGRLDDASMSVRELATRRGVEIDPVYQMVERYDEPIMRLYNEARGGALTDAWAEQQNILSSVSDPNVPVDVSGTSQLIDEIKLDFAEQNPERLMGAGQELDRIQKSIESLPADRLYRELKSLRSRVNDTVDPRYRDDLDSAITRISSSLRDDIGDYVEREAGDLARQSFELRNEELSELMNDFDDASLKSVINQTARLPEHRWNLKEVQKMLGPGTDLGTFRPFYEQLSGEGQELVERAIYGNMLQASNPMRPSPGTFLDQSRRYRDMLRVVHADAPEKLEELDAMVEFFGRVIQPIEQIAGNGVTAGRLGFDSPTSGMVLSQVTRKLGPAGGLLLGDLLQNSFGALARAHQLPEVRDMVLSLRHMTPGSEAELEAMKRILRNLYIHELDVQEEAAEDADMQEPTERQPMTVGRRPGYAPPTNPRVAPAGTR